eukprot:6340754-Karenia_brevis.AAC.1
MEQFLLGCEDMDDAYKALANRSASAVNNFNRLAACISSMCTRITGCLCWHYFDDFAVLLSKSESDDQQCNAQACSRFLSRSVGFPMGEAKRKEPAMRQ